MRIIMNEMVMRVIKMIVKIMMIKVIVKIMMMKMIGIVIGIGIGIGIGIIKFIDVIVGLVSINPGSLNWTWTPPSSSRRK